MKFVGANIGFSLRSTIKARQSLFEIGENQAIESRNCSNSCSVLYKTSLALLP
jgi:hypothetical protein